MGDEDHLLGDDAGARELVLRDHLAGGAATHGALGRAGRDELLDRDVAVVLRLHRTRCDGGVAPRGDPRLAHQRRAGGEVDHRIGLGIGPRRVVEAHRRLERVGERDLA